MTGEELLLFDPETGKLFEVNETGKEIWIMLEQEHQVIDVVKHIKDEFDCPSTVDQDIIHFLKSLIEMNFIKAL